MYSLPPLRGSLQRGTGDCVIGANNRGFATEIGSAFGMGLGETSCVSCGQCIAVCPTGALQEKDCTSEVFAAIADPSKHVIIQTAPAVRAALGEEFGLPIGTNVEGKMLPPCAVWDLTAYLIQTFPLT